ncbi:MAG: hypothetical protein PHQ23_05950 [Candidatus Wallbacteria bacterium]|nr:hypothetical protein [Candidatus Wallbacteria bacterium]
MRKFYVIDDNDLSGKRVSTFFHGKGEFEVISSTRPPKLLSRGHWIFLKLDFDCEWNGEQALEYIRENPGQNFVVLACPGEEQIVERAIGAGARDFLFKPLRNRDMERLFDHKIKNEL